MRISDATMVLSQDSSTALLTEDQASSYHTIPRRSSDLVFDNGDTVRTGLDGLRQLARFGTPLGRSWFLFSGRKSKDVPESISLFIFSPGNGTSDHALDRPWHMPGRLTDPTGKRSFYEAQVFAGEVLRDTIGVIWYERSLMPDGQWRLNTTVLNLNGPRPDTLVFFGHGRKSITMDLAFRGKCQLVDSLDQRLVQ